ncbi:MAG: sigma factor-like helix-turn-helix DNA-binding protein [Caldilineaceae bacterium]
MDLLRRSAYRLPENFLWEMDNNDFPIPDGLDLEEMIVDRLALYTLFQDALNHPALTSMQHQILWLHCVEELAYAEIAKRLHKNITTIRVNRHRAIVALQKDATFMARIGVTLGVHRPSRQQAMAHV